MNEMDVGVELADYWSLVTAGIFLLTFLVLSVGLGAQSPKDSFKRLAYVMMIILAGCGVAASLFLDYEYIKLDVDPRVTVALLMAMFCLNLTLQTVVVFAWAEIGLFEWHHVTPQNEAVPYTCVTTKVLACFTTLLAIISALLVFLSFFYSDALASSTEALLIVLFTITFIHSIGFVGFVSVLANSIRHDLKFQELAGQLTNLRWRCSSRVLCCGVLMALLTPVAVGIWGYNFQYNEYSLLDPWTLVIVFAAETLILFNAAFLYKVSDTLPIAIAMVLDSPSMHFTGL